MTNQTHDWLTVREAAAHARCGVKTVYREVVAGRLKAARLGGRRSLRFRQHWVDAWIERSAMGGMPDDEYPRNDVARVSAS
jgi:excisionase family DNA binding protein